MTTPIPLRPAPVPHADEPLNLDNPGYRPMRPSLPAPDPDAAVEPLLVLRMHLSLARDIAAAQSRSTEHADVDAEMVEAWEAIDSTLHDNVEPAIAMMQRRADEAAGELEAAHVAAERAALRAGSGVRWGRG
jgi:hypothetical protein